MKPEDKKKLQDAWKKAVDRNPDADKPIEGLVDRDGTPVTPRKIMEVTLASEDFYKGIDEFLEKNPKATLDHIIKVSFDKPAPKKPGPRP